MVLVMMAACRRLLKAVPLGVLAALILGCGGATVRQEPYSVVFSGGHEIGAGDFGRPVRLIAAALGVETEVFREAFSGVTPAHGRGPSGAEARKNKAALMKVLAPHGVTNERLDEVSDYYRYQPQYGELWPTRPAVAHAVAHAVVMDGKVREIVVTDAGSGYCSVPTAVVRGLEGVELKVTLAFGKELVRNGAVLSVVPR